MAKIKRFLSAGLVLCMFATAIPLQALAAENTDTTTVTTTEDGLTTTVTNTVTTTTNEDGTPTVVVDFTQTTVSGTTADGVTVESNETVTKTTTGSSTQTVIDGSETKEWDEEIQPGQEVPSVNVQLKPGETTSGSAVGESTTETKDNIAGGSTSGNSDITVTVTTPNREVTVNTGDITMTENAGEVNMEGIGPEDYEGKTNAGLTLGKGNSFGPENSGVPYITVDVVDDNGNVVTDENGAPVKIKIPDPEQWDNSWDYQYLDKSERTISGSTFMVKAEFLRDEDGNIMYNDEGFAMWTYAETWGNPNPQPTTTLSKTVGNNMIALWDKNGNIVHTYCIDKGTNVDSNAKGYIVENLDDCDYFPNGGSKEKLRAIAENGYWGTESGIGSLAQIKENMTDAINNGLEMEFSFKHQNGTTYTYTTKTEEGKALILDMINKLNEGDALVSTQAALWSYSDGYVDGLTGNETLYSHWLMGDMFYGFQTETTWYGAPVFSKNDPYASEAATTGGAAGRMWILYHYLMGLDPEATSETTVLNKESFLSEEGLQLVIGDKAVDMVENTDANSDNDVYNADLSFAMIVEPSTENGDDLIVMLLDKDGNVIRKARLAGDGSSDDDSFSEISKDGNTYTFKDLKLSENSDITFNLKLEGIQNLQTGVYIYKAIDTEDVSGYNKSQTLIGLTGGTQEVDINTSFTVNFNVDETSHVVAKRVWHKDDAAGTPENPEDEQNPPTNYRVTIEGDGSEEIIDEPVPLAAAPKTGDNSGLWILLIMVTGFGIAALNIFGKKNQKKAS